MVPEWIYFSFVGIGAGLMAGLFGIGGGLVTTPLLLLTFNHLTAPLDGGIRSALGTSLAAMVCSTFAASYSHYKKRGIVIGLLRPMSVGSFLGALIGVVLSRVTSPFFLKIFFGAVQAFVGLQLLLFPTSSRKQKKHSLSKGQIATVSTGITAVATILGIGGGMINVPFLNYLGIPIKKAIGTSSALSFLTAFFGTAFFLLSDWSSSSAEYLYYPALIPLSLTSCIAAPCGARLAHRISTRAMKRVFGCVLLTAAIAMIAFR